ncbi:MAG: hypothetical protein E7286_05460 [Lachnospiraceae bacterium]|nr:hypothetical protein [Lachnospiraceae bacterium]
MNETYVECLVSKRQSPIAKALKVFLLVFAGLMFFLGFGFPLFWIPAILALVGAYFLKMSTEVEYEYLYIDREITIDKIMSKSKRKRVGAYEVSRMEIFAPYISHRLDAYKGRKVEEKDCSIGVAQKPDRRYVMYYEGGQRVVLSPSAEMVNTLKNVAPRKVFTD